MNSSDYFSPISIKSDKLSDYLSNLPYNDLYWEDHFGFNASELSLDWLVKDQGLYAIHNLYPIARLGLVKILPNSFYYWHKDQYRLSCINMLIKHQHSHCLFGEERDDYYTDVLELKYKPRTYYLFNNQKQHSVLNFNKTRYMFSLYFKDELNYNLLKDILHPILK